MHKVKGRLHTLIVVILGDEADLACLRQQRHLERQLFLHRLYLRAGHTAQLIVQLLCLLAVRPHTLFDCVSHGTIDQGGLDSQSGNREEFEFSILLRNFQVKAGQCLHCVTRSPDEHVCWVIGDVGLSLNRADKLFDSIKNRNLSNRRQVVKLPGRRSVKKAAMRTFEFIY